MQRIAISGWGPLSSGLVGSVIAEISARSSGEGQLVERDHHAARTGRPRIERSLLLILSAGHLGRASRQGYCDYRH